jgi:hypothetical protein
LQLAVCALLLVAAPAHAQNGVPLAAPKLVYADCTEGEGCACAASAVNLGEAALLLGVPVPPGPFDAYVILRDGDRLQFEPSSLDDLHNRYGGQGACAINLFPATEAGVALEDDELVPRDGVWQVSTIGAKFSQCNPTIETMVRSSGVLNTTGASKRINWNQKFDPAKIEFGNADGQLMNWNQVHPMSYEGTLIEVETCQGCNPFTAEMSVEITSATKIKGQSRTNMAALFPDEETRASMASLGIGACQVTTDFALKHISD